MPRILTLTLALAGLAVLTAAAGPDGPTRPGSGPRPRKSGTTTPVPPPPPAKDWTTQAGTGAPAPGQASPEAAPAKPAPPEPPAGLIDATPPPPAIDPLFDDRPTGSFEPISWLHAPSGNVVANESYTEEACSRLLADGTLPDNARAAVLGGRARARMRMWRLDAARADIERAIEFDPSSAPLRLVHAELLTCFGSTDEADSVVQQAFALDPESTLSARALGLIRFQQGSLQAAADALAAHLAHAAATGDATLPLLRAVAASDTGSLGAHDDPAAPWVAQLAAFLAGRISRETLLERARTPRGAAPDEAACTAWFYLGQRSLTLADGARATLDLLACVRTGHTALPEYRLAVATLIRLRAFKPDSLPGRLAQ
jgi:lipoprotein NlpI